MDLLFPLLIIFMIGMIFFSNRQRKKQAQAQENLQNAIQVGDVVLMTSGISGTVVDTDDERTLDIEIAPEVITTWLRAAVREKLSSEVDETVAPLADDEHDDALEPAATPAAPTASPVATPAAEPKDAPRSGGSSFSDPTASPTGDGVSAGSTTTGESRTT
ncbi:preprotein translocase subunit YajC [Actinomycetospora atypica]|uniref:Preprotein translocase subunit YajC n=1 Tax=Actinomycetospora atypica TaxID=1290095 RepID=A0ABV9YM91_9PSEU